MRASPIEAVYVIIIIICHIADTKGHGVMQSVGVKDGEDHSLENIIEGSNDVRLRDSRRKSAEQMVDFLGEAMMKMMMMITYTASIGLALT